MNLDLYQGEKDLKVLGRERGDLNRKKAGTAAQGGGKVGKRDELFPARGRWKHAGVRTILIERQIGGDA